MLLPAQIVPVTRILLELQHEPEEILVAFNSQGQEVLRCTDHDPNSVAPSRRAVLRLNREAETGHLISVHNHPNSHSFGPSDIDASMTTGETGILVISPHWLFALFNPDGRPMREQLDRRGITPDTLDTVLETTAQESHEEHEFTKKVAPGLGLNYSRFNGRRLTFDKLGEFLNSLNLAPKILLG